MPVYCKIAYMSIISENDHFFLKLQKNIFFLPYELIFRIFEKNKQTTPDYFDEKPKVVLVLKLDSHSKNASIGLLCNPWPIQL